MTDLSDVSNQAPRNPSQKPGISTEDEPSEETGPGEETAEQRSQRRLLRDLALRALI
jgi:hypothetical protein